LLLKIYPAARAIVDHALDRFLRKDLAKDDILDATALAVSARFPSKFIRTVPQKPPRDKKGLPMEIVYAVPQ
jgi:predicted RNase H-like nuclease